MVVRGSQGINISLTEFAYIGKVAGAPRERFTAKVFDEQISHHARVASVAIGERMNLRQPVMKTYGDLIGGKSVTVDPKARIVERVGHLGGNEMWCDPNVELILSVSTCPLPDFTEHLVVQRSRVFVI